MVGYFMTLFFVWRVWLFLIAGIGSKLISFTPSFPYSDIFLIPSRLPSWIWSFANFDGVHYLTIARSGYSAQFTQVFFPLFPLLIRMVNLLFPFFNSITIGLVISNIFFFATLVIFWKLLRLDYSATGIKWIILFLITFPTSFFFSGLYTESLFLFLVVACFYTARQRQWWQAGILGALATSTRLVGIFLLPAIIWELYKNYRFKHQKSRIKTAFYILHSPILYLVPLGLFSYMLYLQFKFGDWLYFWHVQPVFGAQRSGGQLILLPQVIWRYIKIFITVQLSKEIFWTSLIEFIASLFSLSLLVIAHIKRVRLSYLIFSWLAVITPTLTGTFSSMPRYILVAFPMFIVLGLIQNKSMKIFLLFTFFLLLSVLTLLFTHGHWVA